MMNCSGNVVSSFLTNNRRHSLSLGDHPFSVYPHAMLHGKSLLLQYLRAAALYQHLPTFTVVLSLVLFQVAVTDMGLMYTWGAGTDGALGHGNTTSTAFPRLVEFFGLARPLFVLQAAAGSDVIGAHTLAVASPVGAPQQAQVRTHVCSCACRCAFVMPPGHVAAQRPRLPRPSPCLLCRGSSTSGGMLAVHFPPFSNTCTALVWAPSVRVARRCLRGAWARLWESGQPAASGARRR